MNSFRIKLRNIYPLFILALIVFLGIIALHIGLIINVTPSITRGVYMKSAKEIKHGDIVAFCLSEPYKSIGLKSQYIEKGRNCDGTDPLIKEVIAIPGDKVILSNTFITINNKKYPYKTLFMDSNGHNLAYYPRGTYFSSGYWLIGSNSPKSWDSRYWGPINTHQVLYKVIPIFTLPNDVTRFQ